jgi:hypothetical protein
MSSALAIPVGVDSLAYTLEVDLDGSTFQFYFRWVDRDGFWRFDILAGGVPLLQGIKIVVGADLLEQYRYLPGLPPGPLNAVDLTGQDLDPDSVTFGDRVEFQYTPVLS